MTQATVIVKYSAGPNELLAIEHDRADLCICCIAVQFATVAVLVVVVEFVGIQMAFKYMQRNRTIAPLSECIHRQCQPFNLQQSSFSPLLFISAARKR